MPASSIAQILLRLFALDWLLSGVVQVGGMALLGGDVGYASVSLVPSLVYLVAGAVFWRWAPRISRWLTGGNDGRFSLQGVTERQLYTCVFLGLGLYFTLNSFANVFSWAHFFIINKSPDYGFHREHEPSYYDLAEGALTLVAGVALMLTAQLWAGKLTGRTLGDAGPAPEAGA